METIEDGVRSVIQQIYDEHGLVQASELVKAATPEDSPAHNAFEWDDSVAGNEYRLIQARGWIRKVTIVHSAQEERLIHVPVISCEDGHEGHYQVPSVLVKQPEYFARAVREARKTWQAAHNQLDVLKDAARNAGLLDQVPLIEQMETAIDLWSEVLDSMAELAA